MARILIVDDALTIRMYHRHAVEQLGHEVLEAENGVEGLETALSHKPDMVLVDINMPRMDGFRFLHELRTTAALSDTPAVMISTEGKDSDRQRAYACGANLYIVKPVKPPHLQTLVRLILGELAS